MSATDGLRFEHLHVSNFRALREVDVTFPDGLIGIVGENGQGKCLPGTARVYDGKTGEAIDLERFVRERRTSVLGAVDGKVVPVPVSDWHETGDHEIFKLSLDNGVVWNAASTHPVLTATGIRQMGSLSSGDWVAEVRRTPQLGLDRLNQAEAELAGMMIGDGTCTGALNFTGIDRDVMERLEQLVTIVFPTARMSQNGRSPTWQIIRGERDSSILRRTALDLVERLSNEGIDLLGLLYNPSRFLRGEVGVPSYILDRLEQMSGLDLWAERCLYNPSAASRHWLERLELLGKRSHDKRIPSFALFMSEETTGALLRGLWMTDGYVTDPKKQAGGEVSYTTASIGLANDVRLLLARIGVTASLNRKTIKGKVYHSINVTMACREQFSKVISLYGSKGRRLREMVEDGVGRVRNPNLDLIPVPFLADLPRTSVGKRSRRNWINQNAGMSRDIYLSFGGDPKIADSDYGWSRVRAVEATGRSVPMFDLTVDTEEHLYIADTFVVHNSSILWAIIFSLYSTDPIPYKKTSLIGPIGDDMTVSFTFRLADIAYTVERTIRRRDGASTAILSSAAGELARGTEAVSKEIRRLIGNPSEWITSRLVAQKQLNALSVLDPAPRKRLVLRLLGIEAIEKAIEALRLRVSDLDKAAKNKRAILPDGAIIRNAIEEAEVALARVELEVAALSAGLPARGARTEEAGAELASVEAAARAAAVARSEHDLLERAIVGDRSELEALDARLSARDELGQELAETRDLLEQIKADEPELIRLDRAAKGAHAIGELRSRISDLERKLDGTEMEMGSLGSLLAEAEVARLDRAAAEKARMAAEAAARSAETLIGDLRAQLRTARERVEAAARHQGEISDTGICPTCGQLLADPAAARTRAQDEVTLADEQIDTITAAGVAAKATATTAAQQMTEATTAMARADRVIETGTSAGTTLAAARVEAAGWAEDLSSAQAELAQVENEPYDAEIHGAMAARSSGGPELIALRSRLESELKELATRAIERERIAARIVTAESERDRLRSALVAAGADPAEEAAARTRLAAANASYHEAEVARTVAEGERRRIGDGLIRDRAHLAERAALVTEIETEVAERVRTDAVRLLLEQFKISLIGRIRPALERRASVLLRELSDGRYDTLSLDDDYEVSIGYGAVRRSIREVSGGEEDLANLCLRISIGQLISESTGLGSAPVILDEVLGSQDGNRRERIMDLLPRLAAHFPQVLMVAHLPEVQDRFPTTLRLTFDPLTETSRLIYPNPAIAISPAA